MTIDENNVRGYTTADGKYVVFLENCPTIVGKGNTAEEALADLIDAYKSIMRAVNKIVAENATKYCG